jgi:hypothetical protein
VPAFRIVEALDVVEYISSRLVSGPVRFAPCALGLQLREEALHRGIVPGVARTAHRTDDAVIGYQLLELLVGVLAAAANSRATNNYFDCDQRPAARSSALWASRS